MPNFQAGIKDISVLNSYVSWDGAIEALLSNLQYVADILPKYEILWMKTNKEDCPSHPEN